MLVNFTENVWPFFVTNVSPAHQCARLTYTLGAERPVPRSTPAQSHRRQRFHRDTHRIRRRHAGRTPLRRHQNAWQIKPKNWSLCGRGRRRVRFDIQCEERKRNDLNKRQ